MMAGALSRLHGESVLWIGQEVESARSLAGRMIKLPLMILPDVAEICPSQPGEISKLVTDLDQLPFQTGTIDGVVLHHCLEEHHDPRLILREVARVLAPGGRLIVCGFNPWSLMGLRSMFSRLSTDIMSGRKLINPIRLFDWFTLLGFELDAPPLYSGLGLFLNRETYKVSSPAHQFPFGGLFLTSAVKQTNNYHFRFTKRLRSRKLAPVSYPRIGGWTERSHPEADQTDSS
jgi:SAM-dependent methyltransferase